MFDPWWNIHSFFSLVGINNDLSSLVHWRQYPSVKLQSLSASSMFKFPLNRGVRMLIVNGNKIGLQPGSQDDWILPGWGSIK